MPSQRQSSLIGAIPAKFVEKTKPEIIVSYPIFIKDFNNSNVKNNYERIAVSSLSNNMRKKLNSDNIWGSDSLLIYLRKDIIKPNSFSKLKSNLGVVHK